MKENQMWELLSELKSSSYWPAVKSYVARAGTESMPVFRTANLLKEPERAIRAQGRLDGLESFVSEVESEAEARRRRADGSEAA
jgi:hypothetical protein